MNEINRPYETVPVYTDIVYLREHGSWPEGNAPAWVVERQQMNRNSLGDSALAEMALEYELWRTTQALRDMKSAFEAVRSKLAVAAGFPADATWTLITSTVEVLGAGRAKAEEQILSLNGALRVMRKALLDCATIAAKSLGFNAPSEEQAVGHVQALADRFAKEQEVHEGVVLARDKALSEMRAEVKTFQEQDETEAGTWKAHYVDLAQHVGVPRAVYGSTMAPRVDEVSAFIAALMPSYKFAHQVMELERQVKSIQKTLENLPEAQKAPPSHGGCPKCGHPVPSMASFCPKCGQ